MSETYYHQKYLKYKNKYLSLKTQSAGRIENGIATIFGSAFSQRYVGHKLGPTDTKNRISVAFGNVGYIIYQGTKILQLVADDDKNNDEESLYELMKDRYESGYKSDGRTYIKTLQFSQDENFDYNNQTHIDKATKLIKDYAVKYNHVECKGNPIAINMSNIGYNVYKFNAMSSNVLLKSVISSDPENITCLRSKK